MLDKLQTIDTAVLENVVRQDQRSDGFEIIDWTRCNLNDQGGVNPDSLFCITGTGRDAQGIRPWSVVLKIVKDPGTNQDPSYNWYWKREVLAYQSGLLGNLPGPLRAARCFSIQEYKDEAWIWMEHLTDRLDGHWGPDQFGLAGRQLGQLNGAYLNSRPLPDYPWLNRSQSQAWVVNFSLDKFKDHPAVNQIIHQRLLSRIWQLWVDRERFLTLLDSLPATFSHFDYKKRNLFLRKREDGSDELVAIDWAECGLGALGRDLAFVVGTNGFFLEFEAIDFEKIERIVLEEYLEGLREAGWHGDPRVARMGYLAWMSLKWGIMLPMLVVSYLCSEEVRANALRFLHHPAEELESAWLALSEIMLDRADQTRRLAGWQ